MKYLNYNSQWSSGIGSDMTEHVQNILQYPGEYEKLFICLVDVSYLKSWTTYETALDLIRLLVHPGHSDR